MNIRALIPCVNYSDFLAITLPSLLNQKFSHIDILTSYNDVETISLAESLGAKVVKTKAWYENNAMFNKARALNEWIENNSGTGRDEWVLFLDADIFFPKEFDFSNLILKSDCLYSAYRRMCMLESDWQRYIQGNLEVSNFPVDKPVIMNNKAWGILPTINAAGLCGYFHLWNLKQADSARKYPESRAANSYDVHFALTFPDSKRYFLSEIEVLHLGPEKTNWFGRVSEKWCQYTEGAK